MDIRGVNLGGWLVLEKWMAPSLFDGIAPSAVDERSLFTLGGERAKADVTLFRDTFITKQDFVWLRQFGGINVVRLPLGFWCFDKHAAGTPFLPTWSYVDDVFEWAEELGLKVILDFHGAAGSQNGEHHSGEVGSVRWLDDGYRATNLNVLLSWAKRWGRREGLLGLSLGNEVKLATGTAGDHMCGCYDVPDDQWNAVASFYEDAAALCRPHLRDDVVLVVDTCWEGDRWSDGRLRKLPGPVWVDYHHYQCMEDVDAGNVHEHSTADYLFEELMMDPPPHDFIIGEFSLALKPEAEGYGDDGWQASFYEHQSQIASQHTQGWFFWSYKIARDGWPHWSYRESVQRGWIKPDTTCRPLVRGEQQPLKVHAYAMEMAMDAPRSVKDVRSFEVTLEDGRCQEWSSGRDIWEFLTSGGAFCKV